MTSLPVIIGFGGISSAGRSSAHHAYRRTVLESLPAAQQAHTLRALAAMMGLVKYGTAGYQTADGAAIAEADIAPRFRDHILSCLWLHQLFLKIFFFVIE